MKPEKQMFLVKSKTAPWVTVDAEVDAVYMYFRKGKVARTVSRPSEKMILNVDLDSRGEVMGIEAIGAGQVEIAKLLEAAHVRAPSVDWSRLRFGALSLIHI